MAWNHRDKFQEDDLFDYTKPEPGGAGAAPTRRGKNTFTCPGCGRRTYGDMAYCTDCGQKLSHKCPRCGTQWRYEYTYSFCPGCGAQLQPRRAPRDEESSRKPEPASAKEGAAS